eukprot:3936044-Rhodomonas_salina.1
MPKQGHRPCTFAVAEWGPASPALGLCTKEEGGRVCGRVEGMGGQGGRGVLSEEDRSCQRRVERSGVSGMLIELPGVG